MAIDWQQIWEDRGGEAYAMLPLAALYASGWLIYDAMYRFGAKKAVQPHSPIICVGNLIVGGAGKTPVTIHVANVLMQLDREVVISVSGYGARRSDNAHAAPEGELQAAEWGDEAAMIRMRLPDVPLIVGRDRVKAAQICRDLHPNSVLLLDDGFQHLPLKKDISILIDPPEVRNRFCMPSGPYREPRSTGMMRADLVLPRDFSLGMESLALRHPDGQPAVIETPVNALCALARPWRFVDTLDAHGTDVKETKFLKDHDPMKQGNLFEGLDPMIPTVVTEKDWVKILDRKDLHLWNPVIATYNISIEPYNEFKAWLQKKLDEV